MANDRFSALIAAKAAGHFEEHGQHHRRYLRFVDGTVWFPEGYEPPGAHMGFALVFSMAVGSLIAAIVCLMDGIDLAWIFAVAFVTFCALFYWLLRIDGRKTNDREDRLACGVFLLPDELVIREPGVERRVDRTSLKGTKIRSAFSGGGSKSIDYLTLVIEDNREPMHTQLRSQVRPIVDEWISGSSEL